MTDSAHERRALTYRDAGVDIDRADALVERIAKTAERTWRPGVLAGVGGFASAFSLLDNPATRALRDPVIVSGTDGVGTKLKIAFALNEHSTVGIDLVAMCVNDVVTSGAIPLFFLDYFGTGTLDVGVGEAVIAGIAEGCQQAGCALVGGETAELPGLYRPGEYDLAGFAVGVVDRSAMIDGSSVCPGDRVVGVRSRGLHSNGYALAQKALLEVGGHALSDRLDGLPGTLGQALLTPTPIYANLVQRLVAEVEPKSIAHITGGGLPGNLPRVLPDGCVAILDRTRWTPPAIFGHIARAGGVGPEEMLRTFNMGIGLCIVVSKSHVARTLEVVNEASESAVEIGEIGEIEQSRAGHPAEVRWA